jgi:hypothetical protein
MTRKYQHTVEASRRSGADASETPSFEDNSLGVKAKWTSETANTAPAGNVK